MRATMPQFDTIQEYEQAKDDRFWDGAALDVCGHRSGSVYTFGYSVEIALKSAYFRVIKHPIYKDIKRNPELIQAEVLAKKLGLATKVESFHSVLFWADLLRAHRRSVGNPFDPSFETALVHHVQVIYDCWWVDMRYKGTRHTTPLDVEAALAAADWFDKNYDQLWK